MEPRKQAEALRVALETRLNKQFGHVTSVFKQLEDSDQVVLLDGQRLPMASFIIELRNTIREPVAATPPPVRKARIAASE